jgi:hypothetical protein
MFNNFFYIFRVKCDDCASKKKKNVYFIDLRRHHQKQHEIGARARRPAVRLSLARRYGTPHSVRRARARRVAAGRTPLADDTEFSFHTPAAETTAAAVAPAATPAAAEDPSSYETPPPGRNLEIPSAPEKNHLTLLENKVRELELEKSRLERERNSFEEEFLASQKEVIGLKCSIAQVSSASSELRAELETVQRQLNHEQADNARLRNDVTLANAKIQDLQVSVFRFFYSFILILITVVAFRLVFAKKKQFGANYTTRCRN